MTKDRTLANGGSYRPNGSRNSALRGFLKGAIAVGVASLVGVAIIEAILFAMPNLQPARAHKEQRQFCQGQAANFVPSPVFGRTEPPNAVFFEQLHPIEGWKLHVTNDLGFQDTFETGPTGILMFGDSFLRGSLVNSGESHGDLLDAWSPDVGIRAFGIGGWGTGDQLRAYRAVGPQTPHRVVVLSYYLGNDLTDNRKAGYALEDGEITFREPVRREIPQEGVSGALMRARAFLHDTFASYRLVAQAYQGMAGRINYFDLPAEDLDELMRLSSALLARLHEQAVLHGAELVIAEIPDYNEWMSDRARQAADAQRDMIAGFAAERPGVRVVDIRPAVDSHPLDEVYGADRHMSRFGQYLIARELAPALDIAPRPFDPQARIDIQPDCTQVETYRSLLNHESA